MRPYLCIPLAGKRGGIAFAPEATWPLTDGTRWYQTKGGYAFSPKYGLMHRRLMVAEPDEHVDHKNFNRLDNRRENTRLVSQQVNNQRCQKRNTPWPYKGVRQISSGSWQARITVARKGRFIGTYSTAEEAARAYDRAAREAFGDNAVLNFGDTP